MPRTLTRFVPRDVVTATKRDAKSGSDPGQMVVGGIAKNPSLRASGSRLASVRGETRVREGSTGPRALIRPVLEITTVNGRMLPPLRPNANAGADEA